MRVGLIRQDLARIYLDDVENTSQRNFSSQPPGQSRYFEYPLSTVLTSVLNQYAFLSFIGTTAQGAGFVVGPGADTLAIKTSATAAGFTAIVVPHATYSAAALATYLNAQFAANRLLVVASAQTVAGNVFLQLDTIAPGSPYVPSFAAVYAGVPQPPIGLSTEYPTVNPINSGPTAYLSVDIAANSTINTVVGFGAGFTLTGLPVAAPAAGATSLKGTSANAGVYQYTPIAGQTGVVAAVASVGTNGTAVITGLTGMTPNSTLHYLVISAAGSGGNNGTFQIVQYLSPNSVVIANPAAVAPDAGGANMHWTEDTLTFNISYAHIGALSTFVTMEGYSATTPTGAFLNLVTAIRNAIAPGLVETGPVLLSFALGKLSILSAAYFQPGYPPQTNTASPFGLNEGATQRLGYAQGPAAFITEDDGVTPYTI